MVTEIRGGRIGEDGPVGSSVPEAARAAEMDTGWGCTFHRHFASNAIHRDGYVEDCDQPGSHRVVYVFDPDYLEEHDAALVAAAVAEERATSEWQPGRWWTVLDKDGDIWCQTSDEKEARRSMRDPECAPYTLHRQWVTVQRSELRPVRAALASPGEGE